MQNTLATSYSQLNPVQLEAVKHHGSALLVLAGAGSGKTRVITTKIAHLISNGINDPYSILAVTFTNKAAGEMRERAMALTPEAEQVMIRTFHSFGAWFLRRNAQLAGISSQFSIYDDDDVVSLLASLYPNENKAFLRSISHGISRAKDHGLLPDDDFSALEAGSSIQSYYKKYQQRLQEIGNVDFGDLILLPLQILKNNPEVQQRMQQRFQTILVDEYQDSNRAQDLLLQYLSGDHSYVCVVGDDDQSIYRFRGAEVSNILEFPQRFKDCKIIRLEQNYRSIQPILNLASEVISNNKSRLGKTLWSERKSNTKPEIILCRDQDHEVDSIIDIMGERGWEDTAILYRTNAQSRLFETKFIQEGIPYRIIGSIRFYEREEVKDILALLRLIANPKDEIAFRRMINKPSRGIGAKSLEIILQNLGSAQGDFMNACDYSINSFSKKAKEGTVSFMKKWKDWQFYFEKALDSGSELNFSHLGFLVGSIIDESGLLEYHKEKDAIAGSQKIQNLEEIVNAASLYPPSYEGLIDFLEAVELDSTRQSNSDDERAVVLITIHNTKGLEFSRVIVTGMEEGVFPRGGDESLEEIEEERRLFYVAATRAKDELIFSTCRSRRINGRFEELGPSRFLEEIPQEMVRVVNSSGFSRSWDPYQSKKNKIQNAENYDYPAGTRIYHDDYGSGEVIKAWHNGGEELVIVRFETGRTAQFIPKYTPLDRIS